MESSRPGISAIVLAAGEGRRMGRLKQLLPFGQTTMIGRVIQTLQQARCLTEILVVVGHAGAEVARAVEPFGVTVIFNPHYRAGMLSSIQAGLRAASPDATGILIALGDQPHIQAAVVQALVQAFLQRPDKGIFLPVYAGKRGHPALLHARFRAAILALPHTVGLNSLLHTYPEEILDIPVPTDDILRDIDYEEDYRRELGKLTE
ncbi:MAG: nucleotidyltransferase family protein [Nitrospinota bacterium]|nr:MAG: nucleotidyltransferase family protein [Nitrospinota bacterium]